jgi:hypothetical protein
MHSLTSALNGSEWSASRSGRFTPRKIAPGTRWIGGWVGPRAVLDAVVKRIPRIHNLNPFSSFGDEICVLRDRDRIDSSLRIAHCA